MTHSLEAGTIRVLRPDGSTAGTGFLVSKQLAVTCAHVIDAAGAKPGKYVRFSFHLEDGDFQQAKVLENRWSLEDDIAVLELNGDLPKNVRPIPLRSSRGVEGIDFLGLGYPESGPAQARSIQGKIGVKVKVDDYKSGVFQIQGSDVDLGHSGSAIVDTNGRLFGMLTAYFDLQRLDGSPAVRLAYAIPVETIWKIYPQIRNVYESSSLKNKPGSIVSCYRKYLEETAGNLADWERRYTPLFAKIGQLDIFAKLRASQDQAPELLLDLVKNNHNLAIIGTAGSGKSTTLTKIVLDAIRQFKSSSKNHKVPILITLRDFNGTELNVYLKKLLHSWGISLEQIEKDLHAGRYLLLFDGINEIQQNKTDDYLVLFRHFIQEYPRNRFIFTSREYSDDWLKVNNSPYAE